MPRVSTVRSAAACLLVSLFLAGPTARSARAGQAQTSPALDLLAGAKWQYSLDKKSTWTDKPFVVQEYEARTIDARLAFTCPDPTGVVVELAHNLLPPNRAVFRLNGKEVPVPLAKMNYRTIPAIPGGWLKKGTNELTVSVSIDNRPPPKEERPPFVAELKVTLAPLQADQLRFTTGPVLGAAGTDFFTVTCRTNMPVPVTLSVEPAGGGQAVRQTTQAGLMHRFRMDKLDPKTRWTYRLSAGAVPAVVETPPRPVPLLDVTGKLRFVIMGDSRTRPHIWAQVAAAVLKAKPQFVAFSGDEVDSGLNDWLWDEEFIGMAPELFATVPFFVVLGNHEATSPLVYQLFPSPTPDGLGRDWSQEFGPVQIIGIDGQWAKDRDMAAWLKPILEQSKAKFIFLMAHYPAYSSGRYGELDGYTGKPKDRACANARDVIIPLLKGYHATAMVVGHDHLYERTELPDGLTHIISGGAGAPGGRKGPEPKEQNPYSKVFKIAIHYCLFEADGQTCTMKALTPQGQEIDARTWPARKLPEATPK